MREPVLRSTNPPCGNLSSSILLGCIYVVTTLSVSLGVLQEFPRNTSAMPLRKNETQRLRNLRLNSHT